jgi:hypothetical protein
MPAFGRLATYFLDRQSSAFYKALKSVTFVRKSNQNRPAGSARLMPIAGKTSL